MIDESVKKRVNDILESNLLAKEVRVAYIEELSELDKRAFDAIHKLGERYRVVPKFLKDSSSCANVEIKTEDLIKEEQKTEKQIKMLKKIREEIKYLKEVANSCEYIRDLISLMVNNSLKIEYEYFDTYFSLEDKINEFYENKKEFEENNKRIF